MNHHLPFHCLFVFLIHTGLTLGQSGPEPLPSDASMLYQSSVEVLADPTRRLTLTEVWQRADRFQPVQRGRTSFGLGQPPQWLRLQVHNQANLPLPVTITLDNSYLDDARFFVLNNLGQVLAQSGRLDWAVPLARRAVEHRYPTFHVTLSPGQRQWVYARIAAHGQPLVVSMQVRTTRVFDAQDRRERLFWNWMLGIFSWLIVVGLILYVLLGDPVYGLYSLNMISVGLYLMMAKGFWFEWFPGPHYGDITVPYRPTLLTFCSVLSAFLFVRAYALRPAWHQPPFRRFFYLAISLLLFVILLIFIEPYSDGFYLRQLQWIAPLISTCYLLPILTLFGLAIRRAIQERSEGLRSVWQAPAQLYLLSATPLVIHTTLSILHNYLVLSQYPVARHEGVAVAYLLEFILLSIGLGLRYKQVIIDQQQLAKQSLEQQLQLQQEQNRALQAQLKLQHEKERIARDLHDHVGAQLSVIASSLDHVRMTHYLNGSAGHLDAIGSYARDAIGSLRETIWAINTEQMSLAEFRLQLQQYLTRQQTLVPSCAFILAADLPPPPGPMLSSEQALNLFRIFQEAVQNAIRHARAEQITVRLGLNPPQTLQLEIADDGLGFDPQADHPGHYGLANMRLRAERLGGQWQITAQPGQGATLLLTLPLKNTEVYV